MLPTLRLRELHEYFSLARVYFSLRLFSPNEPERETERERERREKPRRGSGLGRSLRDRAHLSVMWHYPYTVVPTCGPFSPTARHVCKKLSFFFLKKKQKKVHSPFFFSPLCYIYSVNGGQKRLPSGRLSRQQSPGTLSSSNKFRDKFREMGRQPCCDKVGLKKGPWTAEEDRKLINFILNNGQCCWRAVPKLAGSILMASSSSSFFKLSLYLSWNRNGGEVI